MLCLLRNNPCKSSQAVKNGVQPSKAWVKEVEGGGQEMATNILGLEVLTFKCLCSFLGRHLVEGYRSDLKTFLGLAMPNQYSQTLRK